MRIDAPVMNGYGKIIGSGLILDGGVVTEILPATDAPVGEGPVLVPGLVDAHCHGGGGASFPDDTDRESIERAAHTHLSGGTVYLVASLVSMADPLPAITALAEACDDGILMGIHLEGPYVSPHKAGAQNPAVIREPDMDELRSWLEAGRGWIKTMTIAPETPGAVDAARMLLEHGAKPSWGHTNTDSATTARVIEETDAIAEELGVARPAQTATHLFNAMPSLHHREPGPIRELVAGAARGSVAVELVGDGVHVHPKLVGDVLAMLNGDDSGEAPGALLVTDAMAGAGMPDGDYRLGSLDVTITGGVATLTGTSTIAGGTARLGDEIRVLSKAGLPLAHLVRAACAAPAHALDLDVDLEPVVGTPLTGVLLDSDREIMQVWRRGEPVWGSASA